MQNTLENNYIKNIPDFVYTPPQPINVTNTNTYDVYTKKIKISIYGAILFIILSLPTAYKILDILAKLFSNNIEIMDDCDPHPLGRVIMAIIMAIMLFIL